jgi:hypothetical protein
MHISPCEIPLWNQYILLQNSATKSKKPPKYSNRSYWYRRLQLFGPPQAAPRYQLNRPRPLQAGAPCQLKDSASPQFDAEPGTNNKIEGSNVSSVIHPTKQERSQKISTPNIRI